MPFVKYTKVILRPRISPEEIYIHYIIWAALGVRYDGGSWLRLLLRAWPWASGFIMCSPSLRPSRKMWPPIYIYICMV
jgi:hypothetical protein